MCSQVEYAMEAIGHAGTCLGMIANDGKSCRKIGFKSTLKKS